MIKRYLPWFRRDWHLTDYAGKVLRLMSTQAFTVMAAWALFGGILSDVFYVPVLVGLFVLGMVGLVIEQPELCDKEGE